MGNTMSDIGRRLRSADPLVREAGLSTEAFRAMRQTIVAAAREASGRRNALLPMVVATAVALTLAAAATLEHYWPGSDDSGRVPSLDTPSSAQGTTRQLQFATPGGTRVIWVFDSKFQP